MRERKTKDFGKALSSHIFLLREICTVSDYIKRCRQPIFPWPQTKVISLAQAGGGWPFTALSCLTTSWRVADRAAFVDRIFFVGDGSQWPLQHWLLRLRRCKYFMNGCTEKVRCFSVGFANVLCIAQVFFWMYALATFFKHPREIDHNRGGWKYSWRGGEAIRNWVSRRFGILLTSKQARFVPNFDQ